MSSDIFIDIVFDISRYFRVKFRLHISGDMSGMLRIFQVYNLSDVLLYALYMDIQYPEGRAWVSQDPESGTFRHSLEAGYNLKQDHPTPSKGTIHPDYHRDLQVLLSQYLQEVTACCVWRKPVEFQRQGSSNFVATSSLLRLCLHRAVARAMVKSVPSESHHPPPGGGQPDSKAIPKC